MINWKSRYTELLEQSERQQKRYKQRQQLLESGFLSAVQLARGIDASLSHVLLGTQRLLKQGDTKNVDLEQGVRALERAAEKSLEERRQTLSQVYRDFQKLSSQTRSLAVSPELTQDLKQLEKRIKENADSFEAVFSCLSELQQLHKVAIKQNRSKPGSSFFDRFKPQPGTIITEPRNWNADPEEIQGAADETDKQEEIVLTEKANTVSDVSIGAIQKPSLASILGSSFVSLLQHLGRPDQTAAVESKLVRGLAAKELNQTLEDICEIGMDTIFHDRLEFHKSIQRVHLRVSESVNQVDGCQVVEEANIQAHEALHHSLEQGIADISDAVDKAESLDSLRDAVSIGLSEVTRSVEAHKQHGKKNVMPEALKELSKHMKHLEDMSRATEFRLGEQVRCSSLDSATGLPNRAAFRQQAPSLLSEKPISIVVCKHQVDVDIESLSECLQSAFREQNRLYRLAENQFASLIPGIDSPEAKLIAEQVRTAVTGLGVTCSVGFSSATASDTIESMVARAERTCQ